MLLESVIFLYSKVQVFLPPAERLTEIFFSDNVNYQSKTSCTLTGASDVSDILLFSSKDYNRFSGNDFYT